MLCLGNPEVKCRKRRGQLRDDLGRKRSLAKATSALAADNTCDGADPHRAERCSKNRQLKARDHKTQNVCDVKDTKKHKGLVLKQLYRENSVSPQVTTYLLWFSECQTHQDQRHVSNSVKMERNKTHFSRLKKKKEKKKESHSRNSLSLLLSTEDLCIRRGAPAMCVIVSASMTIYGMFTERAWIQTSHRTYIRPELAFQEPSFSAIMATRYPLSPS